MKTSDVILEMMTKYPAYPASRIRRMARQIQFLQTIDSPLAKTIQDDLVKYNLELAKIAQSQVLLPDQEADPE